MVRTYYADGEPFTGTDSSAMLGLLLFGVLTRGRQLHPPPIDGRSAGRGRSSGGKVILLKAAIGKSSLVGEFADRHADEAHIHVGYCDDLLTYGSDPYDGRGSGSRCLRSTGMMSSINRTSCDKYQPKSHTDNPVWSAFGPREDQKRRKSMKDVEQQNPRSDYLFRYLPR